MNGIPLHSVHSLINHDSNGNSNNQQQQQQQQQQRPNYFQPAQSSSQQQQSSSSTSPTQKRPQPASQSSSDPSNRPTKRSRKAINCEPCRASKLKCDRGRPCSGCILRNTVAQCYSDSGPLEDGSSNRQNEEYSLARIDPRAEITRIRNSLAVIENHISRTSGYPPTPTSSIGTNGNTPLNSTTLPPFSQLADYSRQSQNNSLAPLLSEDAPPKPSESGFFTGATSIASTLLSLRKDTVRTADNDEDRSSNGGDFGLFGRFEDPSSPPMHPVEDLFQYLPDVSIIDTLIDHYFEQGIWIHRHLYKSTFINSWNNFKAQPQGNPRGHIILATLFCVLAISTQYLAPNHNIITSVPYTQPELGDYYFGIAETAWRRHRLETKALCMDLVEYLLLKVHYLNISKKDCEAIWVVRGQLISFACAMGLHRDPGTWKMSEEMMERRRWAWWNIMMTDRWQSFLFGRPIGITNRHFDTQYPMPDVYDPKQKALENPELGYLIQFRLTTLMGDILDDAHSVRPVPYERILAHDRALQHIIDTMPSDMGPSEFDMARNITRAGMLGRRLAAQTIVGRASLYHIKFALHRPYTTPQSMPKGEDDEPTDLDNSSLELAVKAATDLIHMMSQATPDYCTNPNLAVPGHLSWGSFHMFSAAMFFTSQLIWRPDQPGCKQFRYNVRKAMEGLSTVRPFILLAQKAWTVLDALEPIWDEDKSQTMSEKKKAEVWAAARKLAVPCHDSPIYPTTRGGGSGSASGGGIGSAATSPTGYGNGMGRAGSVTSPGNSISPTGMGLLPTPSMPHQVALPSSTGNTPIQAAAIAGQGPPPPPPPPAPPLPPSMNHPHHSLSHNPSHNSLNGGTNNHGMAANASHGSMVVGPPIHHQHHQSHHSINNMNNPGLSNIPQHQQQQSHHQQQISQPNGNGHVQHYSHGNGQHHGQGHGHSHSGSSHHGGMMQQQQQQQQYFDPTADEALWSASLGLYQAGDWTNIISGVMRPPMDGRGLGGLGTGGGAPGVSYLH